MDHRVKPGDDGREFPSGDGTRRPQTYLDSVMKPNVLGTVAVVVALLAILAAAGWFAAGAWTSVQGPPMPTTGYVAMALGVVFSLIVGCGLMALLFYSSRHGYDEPSRSDDDRGGER
jgi:hypothetical protein